MNWKEPKIIEWDSPCGLTEFDPIERTITIHVPPQDTKQGRFVLRHELLHAKYDRPEVLAGSKSMLAMMCGTTSPTAHHAVADAFVHLIYWVKEFPVDSTESREAVELALGRLKEAAAVAPISLDGHASVEILRSMAILSALGTEEERREGGALLHRMLGFRRSQFGKYVEVLKLVRRNERYGAEMLFDSMLSPLARMANPAAELMAMAR